MSKTCTIICILVAAALLAAYLWVKQVDNLSTKLNDQKTVTAKVVSSNEALKVANDELQRQLKDEVAANKRREEEKARLEEKAKNNKEEYNAAAKNDTCANTAAPAAIIDVLRK